MTVRLLCKVFLVRRAASCDSFFVVSVALVRRSFSEGGAS